jgi:hypothetical protein
MGDLPQMKVGNQQRVGFFPIHRFVVQQGKMIISDPDLHTA